MLQVDHNITMYSIKKMDIWITKHYVFIDEPLYMSHSNLQIQQEVHQHLRENCTRQVVSRGLLVLSQHAFATVWPYIDKLGVDIFMLVLSSTMASADVIAIIKLSCCVTRFLAMLSGEKQIWGWWMTVEWVGKFPCWQWPVLRAASRSQQGQQLSCLREYISGEIREINKVCFEDTAQGERRAPFKAQWQDYDLSMRWAGNQTVSKQNSLKLPDYPSLQAHFSQMSLFLLSVYVNWMAVKIIALVLTAIWFVSLATGESPNAGFGNRTTN